MPIRLLIVDDHALFRQGLKSLLLLQPDVEIVGEVEHAADLQSAVERTNCDVLLLDLQMDRWMGNDIEALAARTKVVVLTASERIEDALAAMRKGARAIVQKRFAVETLMEAIRSAANGLVWMPPSLQTELAAQLGNASEQRLTAREHEIARFVAEGLRNAEIAQRLAISESTVKTHLNNIFQKLHLRDRVELALHALRVGPSRT
ncbi:MAG TPA: response regulator transcription factor [Candidatus Binataceae bacterium]|nr:response regulator transcription factor [Candidatus Binataceae bacterium]